MNTDINERVEMDSLETGDVLDSEDTFFAKALKTVTLPNNNGGFTNHPKGSRVQIDRDEAIKRFGENQVDVLVKKFNKHKDKVSVREVIAAQDGRYYVKD